METIYPSKRDLWLTIVVGLSALLTLTCAVTIWMQPLDWETRLIVTGLLVVQAMFFLDLLLRTDYTLAQDELRIRCGILRWRVPYASIVSVRPGHTLLSGPALSLDRLVITCTGRLMPLVISPADQNRFLEELADRTSRSVRNGGAAGLEYPDR